MSDVQVNDVRVFYYGDKQVRTVRIEETTWWVLVDVCKALKLTAPSRVAEPLDDDEKKTMRFTRGQLGSNSNAWRLIVVNESGLYSVLVRSDKPEARDFKRWITQEVLPSIHKREACATQPWVPPNVVPVAVPVVPELPLSERISRAELLIRAAEHPAISQDEQVRLLNIAVLDLTGMGIKAPCSDDMFRKKVV